MDKNLMRAYFAELIGTFALVFIGAGAVCVNHMTKDVDMRPGLVGIALAQGLILAVALSVTLHTSGGYLNPAVTLTFWSFNRLDTAKMAWYIGAQLLGAVLAGLALYMTFSEQVLRESRLGTPHVNPEAFGFKDSSPGMDVIITGTGIELALTFFLVLAIFGTILDPRGQRTAGLMVGLALAADTLMGFPLTGAAANPARWFGTVFWERLVPERTPSLSPFADMFVYVAGPIVGALLAGLVYYKLVVPADKEQGVFGTPEATGDKIPAGSTQVKAKK
jgi:MIP family channel proteins